MENITTATHRIERIIYSPNDKPHTRVVFVVHIPQMCELSWPALVVKRNVPHGEYRIILKAEILTAEEASAMATAIGMAIQWIAEQELNSDKSQTP